MSNALLLKHVAQGHVDNVVNLIHAGAADVNHANVNGDTPLLVRPPFPPSLSFLC